MLTLFICQQHPRFQLGSLCRRKIRCNGFQPLCRFLLSGIFHKEDYTTEPNAMQPFKHYILWIKNKKMLNTTTYSISAWRTFFRGTFSRILLNHIIAVKTSNKAGVFLKFFFSVQKSAVENTFYSRLFIIGISAVPGRILRWGCWCPVRHGGHGRGWIFYRSIFSNTASTASVTKQRCHHTA